MSNQQHLFICSGCGRTLPFSELTISGPDVLKPQPLRTNWCGKLVCQIKQALFSAKVRKDLDKQGRELIAHCRRIGDKEGEEIAMTLYMIDKMEPVS